jgi:hypothetical protein
MPTKKAAPAKKSAKTPVKASKTKQAGLPLPPAQGAPLVPDGADAGDGAQFAPSELMSETELDLAGAVAVELAGVKTYEADLGEDAPDVAEVVASLKGVTAWKKEEAHAQAWLTHAQLQRRALGVKARALMTELGDELNHKLAKHPHLAEKYPSTLKFLEIRSETAQKGADTRKAKKKAAAPKP